MDDTRFDALTRTLGTGSSRRGLLAGLASGVLAIWPLALGGEDAAAKKKHKKKKKKHKASLPVCTPNCAGKVCGDDGCGGTCSTCGGGKSCQGGSCVCLSDQHDCQGRYIPIRQCCTDAGCLPSERCFSGTCIDLQGDCPVGADFCVDGTSMCGDGLCACHITMDGQTRCGGEPFAGGGCNVCTNDAQCAALHPEVPGALCVPHAGTHCGCGGYCIAPCTA